MNDGLSKVAMNPRILAGKKLDRPIGRASSAQGYPSDPVEVMGQRRMRAVISDRQTVTEGAVLIYHRWFLLVAVTLYKQLCSQWTTQNNSGPNPGLFKLSSAIIIPISAIEMLKCNLLHCI